MTILITGAGLIGTAFARHALKRGEKIVFFDPEPRESFLRFKLGDAGYVFARKDVRDLPALVEAMQQHEVTSVVHTAGLIGGRVQQSLSAAFDINLGGTKNVAEAVRLTGVKRLIHISTFGVYDMRREVTGPVTEDFPRGAGRGYGNYKGAKELILEAYQQQYKFELLMLRPANVYGFGHFFAGSSGGMKMQALLRTGLDGGKARIPASETMANEYIYADDMGRAVDCAATVPMPRQTIFNIGNGYVSPFADVVATVKEIAPALDYEIEPGEPPHSKTFPLDISGAKTHLGWAPKFSLKEGFEDFFGELKRARTQGFI